MCLATLMFVGAAQAQTTWTELVDAGSTPTTAQVTVGPGGLVAIIGTLENDADTDLYCFRIQDPVAFSANLINCIASTDPDLFLFDANAFGVSHNDACGAGSVTLTGTFVLGPGTHYLGVTGENGVAFTGAGAIWLQATTGGERGPDGPGAGQPLTTLGGPTFVVNNASYTVVLTGSLFCDAAVDAPSRSWSRLKILYR